MESVFTLLASPRRERDTHIGNSMCNLWEQELRETSKPFGLAHILDGASPPVLSAFKLIPKALRKRAFVWEEVERILDTTEPKWRREVPAILIRSLVTRNYFRAIASPRDTVVSFADFPNFPTNQDYNYENTYSLSPLFKLLAGCDLLDWIRFCPPTTFLGIINSPQINDFRLRYRSISQTMDSNKVFLLLQQDYMRELPYIRSRGLARMFHRIRLSAYKLLGATATRHSTRAAAPVASFLERIKHLSDQMTKNRFAAAYYNIVHNYNTTYNVAQAGAVGPGATARDFTQLFHPHEQ